MTSKAATPAVSHDEALVLRPARSADAAACGAIAFRAFETIASRHGFPPDFPDPQTATALVASLVDDPGVYVVVAERNGVVVGSNALHEQGPVAGIGPITVAPDLQNAGVGRRLMEDVLRRVDERGRVAVRLVQAAYHARSLSLYAKLGFAIREPLATLQGKPPALALPGFRIRALEVGDVAACDELCRAVHGHDRRGEVVGAVASGTGVVVERSGGVTGYSTGVGFFGHSVGRSNDDLKALIAAAPAFGGPGLLLPMRNTELFGWCLAHGLKVVQTMTLMTRGLYSEPAGPYLPSVIF